VVRRVVTATEGGKSVVVEDGPVPEESYQYTKGFARGVVWSTGAPTTPASSAPAVTRYVPGPGETLALTVTFPPDSSYMDPSFDPAAAAREYLRMTPGLAELFEADAPGMHTTPTVDYVVVLTGTVVLELDDGATTTLQAGDVVVQNATRHAWRVPGDQPATIFVVLMGAER